MCSPKKSRVKKDERRWPRNCFDNSSIANILMTTIQVNLYVLLHVSLRFGTKFTWTVVIKSFAYDLGRHCWFRIFFTASLCCIDIAFAIAYTVPPALVFLICPFLIHEWCTTGMLHSKFDCFVFFCYIILISLLLPYSMLHFVLELTG